MIGERLRECRKNAGLSQEKVAEFIGIDASTYSRIERGHTSPDADVIEQLCQILSCTPNDLFGVSNDLSILTSKALVGGKIIDQMSLPVKELAIVVLNGLLVQEVASGAHGDFASLLKRIKNVETV